MRIFTLLSLVTVVIFSSMQQGYAQTTNHYKIVFEQSLSPETKLFLHKLSNSAEVIYDTVENSATISTSTSFDKNIIKGKLEKLSMPIKSFDLLENTVSKNSFDKSTTISTTKEMQDKAEKAQSKQLENRNNPVSPTPYKRY